jgi:hypothetical protein
MNQDELLYLSDVNLAESYREFSRWSKNADIAEHFCLRRQHISGA